MMALNTESENNSQDPLNVSIKVLGTSTLQTISKLLNPLKVIPTDEKLQRDWQGLAQLVNLTAEDISSLRSSSDPTLEVLRLWCKSKDSSVRKLLYFFEKLDRFDIIDDINSTLVEDINKYKYNGIGADTCDTHQIVLTEDDIENYRQGLPPMHYDAYILYANEDVDFAAKVIEKMEKEYNLNIFVKERDLIGGVIEQNAAMNVIASRCSRLIVILSPAFVQSSENKYLISFAQSIEIDQRRRKIIPCLYMNCQVPLELKPLHMLDYNRSGIFFDFYEKLYSSIITPASASEEIPTTPVENSSTLQQPIPRMSRSLEHITPSLSDRPPALVKSNQSVNVSEPKKSKSKLKQILDTLHIKTSKHSHKKTKIKERA